MRWGDCRSEFRFGNNLVSGDPTPMFFVSVASKGVRFSVSLLDATLASRRVSVASNGVAGFVLRTFSP